MAYFFAQDQHTDIMVHMGPRLHFKLVTEFGNVQCVWIWWHKTCSDEGAGGEQHRLAVIPQDRPLVNNFKDLKGSMRQNWSSEKLQERLLVLVQLQRLWRLWVCWWRQKHRDTGNPSESSRQVSSDVNSRAGEVELANPFGAKIIVSYQHWI